MRKLFLLFIFTLSLGLQAQDFDENKMSVTVPMKFDFLKEKNQYNLNILARVLLKEAGFNVYMDVEEKPLEIQSNPCSNLRFELEEVDSFLRKRLFFSLRDCSDNSVYTSEVGVSNSKKFKEAYVEALRGSFQGFSSKDVTLSNNFRLVQVDENQAKESTGDQDKFLDKIIFKFAGQTYWMIQKSEDHFVIYLASSQNKFAELEAADKGSYIYKSGDLLGAAYFTSKGDLKVEYRDQDIDEVQTLNFNRVQ
ncbi:MAG: hypothetical protein ACTHYV_06135 [Psychroflexus sp.]|uniref:hypothetical protein n=1 Tax=Psychroflexus sp. S27 TaxID=1982757 RepID=UPI000C2A37A5|nr:hypothetical protein [Psychroflexus sp. S27]PJX21859.1 hypothetical protein CAP47_09590 [Psychroflexus sp. S27]